MNCKTSWANAPSPVTRWGVMLPAAHSTTTSGSHQHMSGQPQDEAGRQAGVRAIRPDQGFRAGRIPTTQRPKLLDAASLPQRHSSCPSSPEWGRRQGESVWRPPPAGPGLRCAHPTTGRRACADRTGVAMEAVRARSCEEVRGSVCPRQPSWAEGHAHAADARGLPGLPPMRGGRSNWARGRRARRRALRTPLGILLRFQSASPNNRRRRRG